MMLKKAQHMSVIIVRFMIFVVEDVIGMCFPMGKTLFAKPLNRCIPTFKIR